MDIESNLGVNNVLAIMLYDYGEAIKHIETDNIKQEWLCTNLLSKPITCRAMVQ